MSIWAPRLSTNKRSLSNNVYSCLGVENPRVLIDCTRTLSVQRSRYLLGTLLSPTHAVLTLSIFCLLFCLLFWVKTVALPSTVLSSCFIAIDCCLHTIAWDLYCSKPGQLRFILISAEFFCSIWTDGVNFCRCHLPERWKGILKASEWALWCPPLPIS